jgi:uncharacterized protein (DUF1499 family)
LHFSNKKGFAMFMLRLLLLLAAVLAALLLLAGQFGLLQGKAPDNLGAPDGKLKPPSKTENSVSSQASSYPDHPMRTYAEIAPISFTGDAAAAWAKLQAAVATLPRTSVITSTEGYLYVQCTTLLLRFTDDVEFALDAPNNVIHVRSASRLGRKDLGVNRKRVETVRAAFHAA